MTSKDYDYIICGAGAAGLSLAIACIDHEVKAEILIIDHRSKDTNDRTWCFWEAGLGKYDEILHAYWRKVSFETEDFFKSFDTLDIRYKMLRSKDFYKYAFDKIGAAPNITFVQEEILEVSPYKVSTENQHITSEWVFSSIMPSKYDTGSHNYVAQHFGGWFLKTNSDIFDPKLATLMDFSIDEDDHCRFGYILPFSSRSALVEIAEFSNEVLSEEAYQSLLSRYCERKMPGIEYTIEEREYAIIPMTVYPFDIHNQNGLTHIGTAGGASRGSTGYAFGQIQSQAEILALKMKQGAPPSLPRQNKKYSWFDNIFLNVIQNRRYPMKEVFKGIFDKNDIHTTIRFLTSQSSILDDLKIIMSSPKVPFIKAWINELTK